MLRVGLPTEEMQFSLISALRRARSRALSVGSVRTITRPLASTVLPRAESESKRKTKTPANLLS
jgi:hypothetical protein